MKLHRNHKQVRPAEASPGKALERLTFMQVPEKQSKEELWTAIENRIAHEKPVGKIVHLQDYLIKTTAAAAIVLIGLFIAWFASNTTYSTKAGRQMQVYLPDSSRVTLNAGTEIQFNRLTYHFRRDVKLEGEAWFKVRKGQAFQVKTTGGQVQVLGTSFNVYARAGEFRTHCLSGRVAVSIPEANVTLHAGEAAATKNTHLSKFRFKANKAPNSWHYGRLHYSNERLKHIIAELERQFGQKMELQTSKNRHYTGSFTLQNLDSALKTLCKPMGLSYKRRNQTIVIYNQNQ